MEAGNELPLEHSRVERRVAPERSSRSRRFAVLVAFRYCGL